MMKPMMRDEIMIGIYTIVRTTLFPLKRELTNNANERPITFCRIVEPKP